MKLKSILCVVFAATLLGSCSYDDGDLWDAVNGQEERISALEKWQKTVVEQLNSLQGILTATDYITDVEKVTKEDGTEGYKISFLHASPITLFYNKDGEVSGTNEESIGVDKGDDSKWYWTLGGEPLQVDGKTIYVNSGDVIKMETNQDGSTKLTIGDNSVTIPSYPVAHPVTGVTQSGNIVTITLNGGATVELPKYINWNGYLAAEYSKETAGEEIYPIVLPEGCIMRMLDTNPSNWTIQVTGSGNNTKLKVVYPATGEATVAFLLSDGETQTVIKTVTFKAATDPGIQWTTIEYTGAIITIPEGVSSIKVTGTCSGGAPSFRDHIATPLKTASGVVNIDLSELVYSAAIPANAFYINLPALPEKDKNTSIETIILPKGTINIFNLAFKNCVALKSLTILSATTLGYNATAFEGCDALESIFVATDKVEAYKAGWSALADKIKPLPEAGE